MRAGARSAVPPGAASWLAVGLVTLAGAGTALAAGAGLAGRVELALMAAAATGGAALALLAGGWARAHPLALLALTLPLPALARAGGVRVAPALLATALVVAAWALRHGPDPSEVRLRGLPTRPLLALLAAAAASAAFAEALLPAFRELASLGLLAALLAVAVHEVATRPGRAATLAVALAGLAGAAGVVAGLQAVGVVPSPFPLPGTAYHRATLGFEWPNEAAMFLALLLPFSVHAFVVARGSPARCVLAGAGIVATLLGLAATFSRGSWLAALAAPSVLLLVGEWRAVLRLWLGAALVVVGLEVASGGALSERAAMTLRDPLVGQRLALMLTGLLVFRENPLLGVGPGGFGAALEEHGPSVAFLWDYVGSAHNTFIQVAAETGLPGLLALVVFLVTVFRPLLRGARRARRDPSMAPWERSLRRTILWAFVTACLVAMVEWALNQGVGQVVMLVAGTGLGLEAGRRAGERPERAEAGAFSGPTAGATAGGARP